MADLTVTAANVAKGSGAVVKAGTSGEAITAGQTVYLKSSDGKYYLAQHDNTAAEAAAKGIALNSAPGADQPIDVQIGGNIDPGATVTVGTIYCVSATLGGIAPSTDVGSGDYVTTLGIGTSSSNIKMAVNASGAQIP